MNLLTMAWRGVRARPAVSMLSVVSIALGTGLVCIVLSLHHASTRAFESELGSFDMVVGAKGSPLQLVLSSVFLLDAPTGNIGFETLAELRSNEVVGAAVPIGLGDNLAGYPIVGTETGLFDWRRRGQRGPLLAFEDGRAFAKPFEAVLGADVARTTGLGLGDTFAGVHGRVGGKAHDDHPFTVVGILKPAGISFDRGVFTPLESVWLVHDEPGVEERRELSSVLVQLRRVTARWKFLREVNRDTEAMAASPLTEIQRLRGAMIEPLQNLLLFVAMLVILVASLAVLATLLQAAEQRRRDRAILRAIGAFPRELFALVLLEALVTVVLGLVLGWLLGHGLLAGFAESARHRVGVDVVPWHTGRREWMALGLILAAGVVAGLVPAALNYRRSPVQDLKQAG